MSTVRRAFWLAGNMPRFIKARAATLARLHERERRDLAAQLQNMRNDWTVPRPMPTAPKVLTPPSRTERATTLLMRSPPRTPTPR